MLEMGKRHLSNMIELHIKKKFDYILVYNAWWSWCVKETIVKTMIDQEKEFNAT